MKNKFDFYILIIVVLFSQVASGKIEAQFKVQVHQNFIKIAPSVSESTPSMPESRCTVPKTAKTDLEFSCLKGNVRTVRSENAIFENRDGRDVKIGVSHVGIYNYDEKGNLIERASRSTGFYGTDPTLHRIVYTFNSDGVATGWEEYSPGKTIPVKNVYEFNSRRQRIRQTVTYPSYGEQSILIFVYDSAGNKIEERGYYPVPANEKNKNINSLDEKYFERLYKYKYDGNNLVEISHYNKGKIITHKILHTYENGNKKEVNIYSLNENGDLIQSNRITYKYDEKDNIIEKVIYKSDGSIETRHVKDYDDHGFVISHIIFNSKGKIKSNRSLKYNYDSHGNWLSYTTNRRNSNDPFQTQLRTIEYYK